MLSLPIRNMWGTWGFPVLHHLLEVAQIHVHWVSDAIQPSCPLQPLLLLPSAFPRIRVFSIELALCSRWPKYLSFSFSRNLSNEYSHYLFRIKDSVQFSQKVMSDSLWPHRPQQARPPCPSPTPGIHPNPCPWSRWCPPTIASSVVPFSSRHQSFPASVFSDGSVLHISWPKYWSFSFSINPSNE